MSDSNSAREISDSAPSVSENNMDVSASTVEKELQIEINDSKESKENHSMDCASEGIEVSGVKSIENQINDCKESKENHSMDCISEGIDVSGVIEGQENVEPTNCENSNETSESLNQSTTPVETLSEQLIDEDKKDEELMEKDKSVSLDNEITVKVERLDEESSKNKENNNFIKKETESPTKSENFNIKSELFYIDNFSSLDVIAAQYDSSDSENENENKNKNDSSTKVSNSNVYRNMDASVATDSDSSDSESDSSSSESESDSDNDSHKNISSDDSDEEKPKNTKGNKSKKTLKPKSEFDILPPIEDLKISVPEVLCEPLGEVAWTVEQMVVVRPKAGKPALNLDTVLFINKGQRALGHIFDVFGQVAEPYYCVRFNSSEHIQECEIKVGMTVYFCPNTQYTSLIFLSELTKMKAVDDIGDDEAPQFSDDEEEQAYLASLKNKQNKKKTQEPSSENPNKRRRGNKSGWQSNHPWNSNKDQQNAQPHSSKPFYRPHHPWSRPRHQPQNQWHPYNLYPNQWMEPQPHPPPPASYNQMQAYNQYFAPAQTHPIKMPNQFPQGQWNPLYQLPQVNALPLQGIPPTFGPPSIVPPFNLPPPPPPPPPPSSST